MPKKKLNPISRLRLRIRFLLGDDVDALKAAFDIDHSTIWRNTKSKGLVAGDGCGQVQVLNLLRLWKEEVAGGDLGDLDDQEVAIVIMSMINVQALRQNPTSTPSAFDLPAGIVLPGSS